MSSGRRGGEEGGCREHGRVWPELHGRGHGGGALAKPYRTAAGRWAVAGEEEDEQYSRGWGFHESYSCPI